MKPFLFDSDVPGFSEDSSASAALLPSKKMEITPVVATSFSPRALNMSSLQALVDSDAPILQVVPFEAFPFVADGTFQRGLDDLDVRVGSSALRARPQGSAYVSNPNELWVVAGFDVGEPERESSEQPTKSSGKAEASESDGKAGNPRNRRGQAESAGLTGAAESGNGASGPGAVAAPVGAPAPGSKRPWLYSFRRFVPIAFKARSTDSEL